VEEARRRAAALDLAITFEVGDAHALALPDGQFDVCRTARVVRYLEGPERVVREMARVVGAGATVLAFDFDSDQTVVDAPDRDLTRRIAEVLDAAVPHPWIGRKSY
jgi:ubiquinone/menaquinone biosynthesis C-methylase UbiE